MDREVNLEHRVGRVIGRAAIVSGRPTAVKFTRREGEETVSADCLDVIDPDIQKATEILFGDIYIKRNLTPRGLLAWFHYSAAKTAVTDFFAKFDKINDPTHVGMNITSISAAEKITKLCKLLDPKTGMEPSA